MSNEFKYKIEDKKLIIESCPIKKISLHLISDLLENKLSEDETLFEEIHICEGVEEIGEGAFAYLTNLVKVKFPNSLKKIEGNAFSCCESLEEISFPSNTTNKIEIGENAFTHCKSLSSINIPNGVIRIGSGAFSHCQSLQSVYLPDSLTELGDSIFSFCKNLKSVHLPANLEKIERSTFLSCSSLQGITLPKGLKQIEERAFKRCDSLEIIAFPDSLAEIKEEAFSFCNNMENIVFSEGLEKIHDGAFSNCISLEEISLPHSLKYIGKSVFAACLDLKSVVMDDNVEKIGESVFCHCNKLEHIRLSKKIKIIPFNSFYDCVNLREITLPENIEALHESAFYACRRLKDVTLSKNIKKIPCFCFDCCESLEKIVLPDGIEEIQENAFANCSKLYEVYLPTTLKKFDTDAFEGCRALSFIYLKNEGNIVKLCVYRGLRRFVRNPDDLLFLHCLNDDTNAFYLNGEYTTFKENILLNNDRIVKIIQDNCYDRGMYVRLYYWSKKRFIPSNIVIEEMPLKDIDNFYTNKNGQEWAKLVKSSVNVTLDESKASFFKLCYVLGVFSESTSIRDKAVEFLNKKIVNVLDGHTIHSKFDGFDLSNGFIEEYAEFFMKYYENVNFMVFDDGYTDIDLTAASYNNFKNVKKVYPNKTLHTNREADLLLPEHVINAIKNKEYENVDPENEIFALTVGRYGYTQEQFEKLQSWYNKGKQIQEMKLFIDEDREEKGITYSLLSKKNPLIAILGNITNCCQVVDGAGEECVEYGMTMPNSGFITFNYDGKIIGQSWVWYDEESKTVCLDNIEIPHRYLEKINQNKIIQRSFIDCLLRIEKRFKEEMNKRGLEVDKVTIGEGYNDIKEILDKNFQLLKYHNFLSGYGGYTDASSQYLIKAISENKIR